MKTKQYTIIYVLAIVMALVSCTNQSSENKSGSKADVVMDSFIDSLLQEMTLKEKIGQTVLFTSGEDITGPTLDDNYINYLKSRHAGSCL